jgi:hypothetical protein
MFKVIYIDEGRDGKKRVWLNNYGAGVINKQRRGLRSEILSNHAFDELVATGFTTDALQDGLRELNRSYLGREGIVVLGIDGDVRDPWNFGRADKEIEQNLIREIQEGFTGY